MQSLPTRIANLTLMRRLGANALAESFLGVLDDPPGRMVSVRRLHPWVVQSPDLMRQIETRLLDLSSGSHPSLVNILEYVDSGDERLVVEEWMESVSLAEVISWCQRQEQVIPHAILLDLGVRVCDALDALHARVGRESRDEHVLHQGLRPSAVRVTREGRLVVGGYGLVRSENALPQPPPEAEIAPTSGYLTPEQTWPDRDLSPATDLFALGTLLFEMSTLKPLFDGSNPLATIKLVRNAEVDISLIEARSAFPGLEKVLYRALTENPKHRYQRAFVLREDLRGLMAGYDFTHIQRDLLDFLTPIFLEHAAAAQEDASRNLEETTANLLGDPMGMPVRDLGERLDPLAGLDLPDRPDTLIPDDPSRWEDAFAPLDVGMLGGDYDTAETGETIPPLPLDRPIPPPPAAPSPLFPEPSHRGPSPSTFSFERQDEPARQVVAIPHDEPARQVVAIPQDEPARQVVAIPQDEPARQVVSVPQEQAPREQAGPTLAPPAPEPGRGKGLMIGASLAVAFLAVVVCAGLSVGGLGVGLMGQGDRAATERLPIEPAVIAPAEPPPPAEVGSPPQGEVPAMRDPVGARTSQARPAQPDRPTARTAPPAQPAAPASRPAAQVTERVEPTRPAALPTPTRSVDPVEREEPDLSFLQEEREEALAELPPPPPPEELEVAIGFEDLRGELAGLSDKAYRGALTDADRQALAQVPAGDPARTQVLVLLYQDAKARGDQRARAAFIADALAMPENQYNPQLLVESAAVKMAAKDYAGALEQANIAERYWARLPSDSIFSRKAMIYEIQASAEQGIFYRSEGEDTEALHEAIRGWEKYLRHVNSKSRRDLAAKADEQLAKLYDMQRRLE